MSLNHLKAVGPNIIPTKILKLVSNDIKNQLTEMLNLSFSLGVFSSVMKSSKVIPNFKKVSNLKCDALRDLVLFVQFKKSEKHPWRIVTLSKVAG